jgi:hypothetical protein
MEYEEFEYIKGGHLSLSFHMYDIPELVFPSRISFIEGFMHFHRILRISGG